MYNLVDANIQTMSSKEIAELTGKNHGDVLRDIRNMLKSLADAELHPLDYKELFRDNGQLAEILLNKRLTYILVTGYSVVLRAKVIDRWQELENATNVPKNYNEAIKALANSIIESEKLALEVQAKDEIIIEQAPKVAVYERICASNNTFGVRDVANFYDMRQTDLINLLIDRKWIYRYANGNNLRAGSSAKETGLVVQKMNVRFAHSPNYLGTQVRITTKGIVRIAKVLGIVRDDEFFTKMESEFSL